MYRMSAWVDYVMGHSSTVMYDTFLGIGLFLRCLDGNNNNSTSLVICVNIEGACLSTMTTQLSHINALAFLAQLVKFQHNISHTLSQEGKFISCFINFESRPIEPNNLVSDSPRNSCNDDDGLIVNDDDDVLADRQLFTGDLGVENGIGDDKVSSLDSTCSKQKRTTFCCYVVGNAQYICKEWIIC